MRLVLLFIRFSMLMGLVLGCHKSNSWRGLDTKGSVSAGDLMAKKDVDKMGGLIGSDQGGALIDIPAGALDNNTPITIQAATSASPSAVGPTYVFGPEGTIFKKPVSIVLAFSPDKLPPGTRPEDVRIVTAMDASASYQILNTALVDSTHVRATTTHFSIFYTIAKPSVNPPTEGDPLTTSSGTVAFTTATTSDPGDNSTSSTSTAATTDESGDTSTSTTSMTSDSTASSTTSTTLTPSTRMTYSCPKEPFRYDVLGINVVTGKLEREIHLFMGDFYLYCREPDLMTTATPPPPICEVVAPQLYFDVASPTQLCLTDGRHSKTYVPVDPANPVLFRTNPVDSTEIELVGAQFILTEYDPQSRSKVIFETLPLPGGKPDKYYQKKATAYASDGVASVDNTNYSYDPTGLTDNVFTFGSAVRASTVTNALTGPTIVGNTSTGKSFTFKLKARDPGAGGGFEIDATIDGFATRRFERVRDPSNTYYYSLTTGDSGHGGIRYTADASGTVTALEQIVTAAVANPAVPTIRHASHTMKVAGGSGSLDITDSIFKTAQYYRVDVSGLPTSYQDASATLSWSWSNGKIKSGSAGDGSSFSIDYDPTNGMVSKTTSSDGQITVSSEVTGFSGHTPTKVANKIGGMLAADLTFTVTRTPSGFETVDEVSTTDYTGPATATTTTTFAKVRTSGGLLTVTATSNMIIGGTTIPLGTSELTSDSNLLPLSSSSTRPSGMGPATSSATMGWSGGVMSSISEKVSFPGMPTLQQDVRLTSTATNTTLSESNSYGFSRMSQSVFAPGPEGGTFGSSFTASGPGIGSFVQKGTANLDSTGSVVSSSSSTYNSPNGVEVTATDNATAGANASGGSVSAGRDISVQINGTSAVDDRSSGARH